VGPRTGLDSVAKRKSPCSCQESNSDRPARSLVTILTKTPEYVCIQNFFDFL
jgi:hypothetical protein